MAMSADAVSISDDHADDGEGASRSPVSTVGMGRMMNARDLLTSVVYAAAASRVLRVDGADARCRREHHREEAVQPGEGDPDLSRCRTRAVKTGR